MSPTTSSGSTGDTSCTDSSCTSGTSDAATTSCTSDAATTSRDDDTALELGAYTAALVCDIEDAADLAGQPCIPAMHRRARELGWRLEPDGWMRGRHFFVLLSGDGGGVRIEEMYLPAGVLSCSLTRPALTVCHEPMWSCDGGLPCLEDVMRHFDKHRRWGGCPRRDRPFVAAAHAVLASWFR